MKTRALLFACFAVVVFQFGSPMRAQDAYLSFNQTLGQGAGFKFGGLPLNEIDPTGVIFEVDKETNRASILFDTKDFFSDEGGNAAAAISAFDILDNGNVALSFEQTLGQGAGFKFGGLPLNEIDPTGVIFEVDKETNRASILFDTQDFFSDEGGNAAAAIRAFDILDNGNVALSFEQTLGQGAGFKFGGLPLNEIDPTGVIFEVDKETNRASILFDTKDFFSDEGGNAAAAISAFDILDNGNVALSFEQTLGQGAGFKFGGLPLNEIDPTGVIFEVDKETNRASILFDTQNFFSDKGGNAAAAITAFSTSAVPEPSAVTFLAATVAILILRREHNV